MPNKEKQENQENSPKKQGFFSKMADFAANSALEVGGAIVGAVIGSVIPGLGTLAGAVAGAAIVAGAKVAVKGIAQFVSGNNKETAPLPSEQPKSEMFTPENQIQAGISNTAQMTAQLGGAQKQASLTASLIEAPIVAPKPVPSAGANPLNAAFFDKQSGIAAQSPITPMSNPAALPKPRPSGAASAA